MIRGRVAKGMATTWTSQKFSVYLFSWHYVSHPPKSKKNQCRATKITKVVKNDLKIKEEFNFKQTAKDVLITSQLRTALITNKKIKSANYDIDTYKKIIYVYGISQNEEERAEVINEAKEVLDVEDVVTSIFLVEDLRVIKN